MAAISTLRAGVAAALVDNTKYSVFSFPPATPIANSVVISPADPYISPSNGWRNTIAQVAVMTDDRRGPCPADECLRRLE